MARLLPRTLFWQLVLAIFAVQIALLFTYVSYLVISQRALAQARGRERLQQQLSLLAPVCEKLLAGGDIVSLREVLTLARISPSVDRAKVTDLQGDILASTNSSGQPRLEPYEQQVLRSGLHRTVFDIGNGQIEAVAPIARNGTPVAMLWLEPNHATSLSTLNTVVRVAGTYGAFALLANVLPIFLVVRTITRPLTVLREATRQLGEDPSADAGFPLPASAINEAGELTRSFNTMVSEVREQRAGLLETLAILDSMLGNAPIGIGFFDADLRCIRANAVLASLYELPLEALPGRRGPELHPGHFATQLEEWVERVFNTGDAIRDVEISKQSRSPEDRDRSYLVHFYPVRAEDDAIRRVGVITVEITERLRAEEALRKTEKLAATGRLAASIAHEINNPLEAVTNILYILETDEQMHQTGSELVSVAQAELARVAEITQQTLRFYRQPTSAKSVNLAELLESVLSLYAPRLLRGNIAVARRFRGSQELVAFDGELRQVFANIVGNAVDAMPGGGTLALSARPACGRRPDGRWSDGVRVTISDSGIGMSAQTLERIFEPFFTTKKATGTGLGLWLSGEIIRKHGGAVRVRSRRAQKSGTTFMLFFPCDGLAPGTPARDATY